MKQFFYVFMILALVLTGCSSGEKTGSSEPIETVRYLDVADLNASQGNPYKAAVAEFDLGKKEYLSLAGKIMPYNIKGIIGVPEGDGPFPLILITHGSHSNDDESKRFDTGYDYLVGALAENGYIVVSMDMSKPYIWRYGDNDDQEKSLPVARDHMESLMKANAGSDPGYGIDLKGKIDLEKIGLIGHSRGGETIFEIAADQKTRGIDIQALLALAPTSLFAREEWPDSHVAILVPEYDGDVIGLDGFNIYRFLDAEGKGSYYVTLLRKANHNYFNRNITRNDAAMSKFKDITDQLTRTQQEDFLKGYAVGFFNASLRESPDGFIAPDAAQPNKMYGLDVKTLFTTPGAVDLADVKTTEGFQGEGARVEATVDSWFFKDDKILIDTVTSGIEPYNLRPLINVQWEGKGGQVTIAPKVHDFSQHTALTLNLVIDSADELNQPDLSQRFTVALTDSAGNITKLVLPEGLNALAYTPGKIDSTPLYEENLYYWSALSPISSVNLPLREFQNIDLAQVQAVRLIFDQTDRGSFYIDSITLQ